MDDGRGDYSDDRQYDWFLDRVADHLDVNPATLADNEAFQDAYADAFGEDVLDARYEHDGILWKSSYDYAVFLAEWLDYEPDDIDDALGYEDGQT